MGHDTIFHLAISQETPTIATVAERIANLERLAKQGSPIRGSDISFWEMILQSDDYTSWYTYNEDMQTISKEWPGVLFTLDGAGDDHNDRWTAYYMNGQGVVHSQPDWEPPPFDPKDLHDLTGLGSVTFVPRLAAANPAATVSLTSRPRSKPDHAAGDQQ